ncbi:hypothetical protein B0G69_5957 [Paraburkholderia sp. RAU2J]|uniref:hypothetical protein n=1 Tax=Paraburkholderia sp. RAU2J TaxID=1938810 RepID=UPI000EAE9D2F|nr:hypothetical protein [Paraburkholderia sp. RAU2J]RKT22492.1 hypothetical protein B0G69_5957 [Paraburkholderia sp. RAU2J]
MTNEATGLLAIWSTIASESETDYMHWLTREHVFERVSVPGFRSGRVLKRRGSRPSEYVMLYDLDNADVMSSPGYLERLNDPTPWTRRIMPTLEQFRRGGGVIPAQGGNPAGHGGRVAIARFEGALPDSLRGDQGRELVNRLAKNDWIANVQIMTVKNEATSIATQEKSMRRSSEGEFAGLLVIEALDSDSLDRTITLASESGDITPDSFASYDLVFVCTAQQ